MCAPRWDSDARVLLADRRGRALRGHPDRAVRVGWLLRGRHPDLAHRAGSPRPGSSSAARRWPSPATATARCCCAGSRRRRARPGSTWSCSNPRPAFGRAGLRRAAPRRRGAGAAGSGACGCAGRAARTPAHGDGRSGRRLTTTSRPRPRAAHHDLVLELSEQALARPAARPGPGLAGHRGRLAVTAVPELDGHARPARRAALLRGAARADQRRRRHGRRRHDGPARTRRAGRNYDYRYVWIRDQCYAGQAVAADGPHPLLDDAVGVRRRPAARRRTEPETRLHRHRRPRCPTQQPLDLPGYPGGTDIVGNQVNAQFQLDALRRGAAAVRRRRPPRPPRRRASQARRTPPSAAIEARWREPDAGIWELDDRRWAHSRLICAAGLRAIAAAGAGRTEAAAWSALADAHRRRHRRRLPAPERALAARPRRSAGGRRAAAPGDPRRAPGRRSAQRGHAGGRSPRSWPRTATSTGSARTRARWGRPRARSCCAGS